MPPKLSKSQLLALGISIAIVSTTHSQDLPALMEPDISKLSADTKDRLSRILVQQALNTQLAADVSPNGSDLVASANPDPEYSEFWVELRPAPDPEPDDVESFRQAIADGRLSPTFLNASSTAVSPNDPAWSEEAFFEITPEFGDMYPPLDDEQVNRNVLINIRAIDEGEVVSDERFYENILNSLRRDD